CSAGPLRRIGPPRRPPWDAVGLDQAAIADDGARVDPQTSSYVPRGVGRKGAGGQRPLGPGRSCPLSIGSACSPPWRNAGMTSSYASTPTSPSACRVAPPNGFLSGTHVATRG